MRNAYLITGSIGSGKSVIGNFILSDPTLAKLEYVGSDVYKYKFFAGAIDDARRGYRCADELAFYRITQICKTGTDFAYEFCPTNLNKIETIKHLLRKYEYTAVVFFVGTERNEINVTRCKNREANGADHVPDSKIKSRYDQALNYALEMIQLSTTTYIVDNSMEAPRMIASISDKAISIFDDNCRWFKKHIQQKLV